MVVSRRLLRRPKYLAQEPEMKAALAQFPPKTPVLWFDEPMGEVTGHTDDGRVMTTKTRPGVSLNPLELKVAQS